MAQSARAALTRITAPAAGQLGGGRGGQEDITALVREVEAAVKGGELERAGRLVPIETPWPLLSEIARRIDCTSDEG